MISREELVETARLAALDVSEAELDGFVAEMSAILTLADAIPAVNVADSARYDIDGKLRDDVVTPSVSADELLRNAPCSKEQFFIYPNGKARGI